ncbi:MAG: RepB family DNA primase [Desulfobacteraceae bacterium]|nr:RepB family DNA primase [Desulfobacteraceae bacterium]
METIFWKIKKFFKGHAQLAVLDEKAGRWFVRSDPKSIPYLKAENANGRHILIKPDRTVEPFYLLVDDLNSHLLGRHHKAAAAFKAGRMVVETSPGNYQVWIHALRPLDLMEKRYWLKKMNNDPGADPNNRWGRCPGFRNRKQKHKSPSGQYPLAKLIWVDWKYTADIPKIIAEDGNRIVLPHQPRGGVCQSRPLARSSYNRADESATDFAYALALYRKGLDESEIMKRICFERQDWKNHTGSCRQEKYLVRTLAKVRKIIG